MTCDRVYRPSIGEEAAAEEISRSAGTQFDEQVFDAFLRAVAKTGAHAAG